MVEKSDVAAVLELIRPSLQADGGDVALAHAASEQHEEHSLLLGHMSSFLSAAAYSAVGKKSRDAMRRYQIQAISGTTMC